MTSMKSVRLSRKGRFVIPKEMREALGVQEGGELLVGLDDSRIVVTTPREHARATRGSLKGTWGRSRHEIDRYLASERRSWR
jgi:AbrB family looped-hinge helix DNA binding protein